MSAQPHCKPYSAQIKAKLRLSCPRPKTVESMVEFEMYRLAVREDTAWAFIDKLPEPDVSDLVRAHQYQSTIDAEFLLQ